MFKLVGRAVAAGRAAAVQVETGVEIVRPLFQHFKASFFQTGKRATRRQQFRFEGAPARFGLSIVVRVARPAETGQRPGLVDALATRLAGVLAAPVGVDDTLMQADVASALAPGP